MQLVAPTSTDERIALAAERTDGWLYLVTVAGTTGARTELSPALAPLVERTRALTDVPLYAGFGISTPAQAAAAAELADGVVVGSAALLAAEDGPAALERFVAQLRAALEWATSQSRATCQASEPASMCSKWPVCERTTELAGVARRSRRPLA